MNLKDIVKETVNKVVTTRPDSAYAIESNFYLVSREKYLKNLDGEISGVTGSNLYFKDSISCKEFVWKYLKDAPSIVGYVYLYECDNYNLRTLVKEVCDDDTIIGFTKQEIKEIMNNL